MRKAILEFDIDLLDGKYEYDAARNGVRYKNIVVKMANHLRHSAEAGDLAAAAFLLKMDALAKEHMLPEVRELTRGVHDKAS